MVNGKVLLLFALVVMVGGPIFVKVAERSVPERQAEKLDASVIFGPSKISGTKDEEERTTVLK